jgi:hypothetical protein
MTSIHFSMQKEGMLRRMQNQRNILMAPAILVQVGDEREKIKVLSEAAVGATRRCWVDGGAMEEK